MANDVILVNGVRVQMHDRGDGTVDLLISAGGAGGLTNAELRATAVPVTLGTEEVQLKRVGTASYAAATSITNAATLIKAAVVARVRLEIHHQGPDAAARVWLGPDNTLTAGAAGKNFGYLDPGDTWETRDYTGAVYGRTEAGTAYISYLEA